MKRMSAILLSSILLICTTIFSADKELDELRNKADEGDPSAQIDLGYRILGKRVEKDYLDALKWYRKAAEQGHSEAQFILGYLYHTGKIVEQNSSEAKKWYLKAAKQGHASAEKNFRLLYAYDRTAEKDSSEIKEYYRKKAERGDAYSQYALGLMYDCGLIDYQIGSPEASKWFRKAAEQGHSEAQNYLGVMYQRGQGLEKDYVEAYAWYNLARANTSEKGTANRDALAIQMSDLQVAEAQNRTKELKNLIGEKKVAIE